MIVYLGSNKLKEAYIGSQKIKEIRVGDKRVFPEGYVPTSNTLFYVTNNGEITDHSPYNHTMNWYGTAKYATLTSGQKVLDLDGSTGLYSNRFNESKNKTTFTLHVWQKDKQSYVSYESAICGRMGRAPNSSTYDRWGLKRQADSNSQYRYIIGGSNQTTSWQSNSSVRIQSNTSSFQLFTVIQNGKTCTLYRNGMLVGSRSWSYNINGGNSGSDSGTRLYIGMGGADDNGSVSNGQARPQYIGEVILEDKVETQAEIQKYFNLTKALYGVS